MDLTVKEFLKYLFRSWKHRWKLRKNFFPENPSNREIEEYECGGCGSLVNQGIHGECPRCFSRHLFYIGR